jgi:hypothetical protein
MDCATELVCVAAHHDDARAFDRQQVFQQQARLSQIIRYAPVNEG